MRFFDATGADISEDAKRKIERLFQREDYRRVLPEEIGDISFPPRALEDYTVALEATVDIDAIYRRRFKLVVDHGYGATSFVMPNVLAKLGADVLSVNPYASTSGHDRVRRRHGLRTGRRPGRASGAHLGAVFDPDGERLFLVDDEGALLDRPRVPPRVRRPGLRPPARRPRRAAGDGDAARRPAGRRPRRAACARPRCRRAALADAATEPGVGFAADGDGGFILPGFLPAFDAAAAFVKMLDLLARERPPPVRRARGLPRVHIARETVVTPWDQKGLVMRSLVEHATASSCSSTA